MSERFGHAFWERRWDQVCHDHGELVRDLPPNPELVASADGRPPGLALDAGCGHGADAVWLAARGWRVTAADFATAALDRARRHAATLGAEVADRIDWVTADLSTWAPADDRFDLVTSHYVHGVEPRDALFRRLAASVAPGGTLLIVGHDPACPSARSHGGAPELSFTADEVAAALDPDRWRIVVAETRTRRAPGNIDLTLHDAVLRAHKLP